MPPQIRVVPTAEGFDVIVADGVVRHCDTEAEAHHWAMHAIEAIYCGVHRPSAVRELLLHICLRRQQVGTHRPTSVLLPTND